MEMYSTVYKHIGVWEVEEREINDALFNIVVYNMLNKVLYRH